MSKNSISGNRINPPPPTSGPPPSPTSKFENPSAEHLALNSVTVTICMSDLQQQQCTSHTLRVLALAKNFPLWMGPCVFSNSASIGKGNSHRWKASKRPLAVLVNRGIFKHFFSYVLYSTLLHLPPPSEDAGIEPRIVALITCLNLIPARLDRIPTSAIDLIPQWY